MRAETERRSITVEMLLNGPMLNKRELARLREILERRNDESLHDWDMKDLAYLECCLHKGDGKFADIDLCEKTDEEIETIASGEFTKYCQRERAAKK
jgi:hypothetical protein